MYTEKFEPDVSNPYGYIYITTNLITGKRYCGKHKSACFDPNYLGSGVILKQDIVCYGVDCFKSAPIEWAETAEELHQKEVNWIQRLNAVDSDGWYNLIEDSNQYKHHLRKSEPPYVMICLNEALNTLYDLPLSCSTVLFGLIKKISYANSDDPDESMVTYVNSSWKQDLVKNSSLTSTNTVNNALALLVQKGILRHVSRGKYQVNPFLFGKGKWTDIYELRMTHIWNSFGHTVVTEAKRQKRSSVTLSDEDKEIYDRYSALEKIAKEKQMTLEELLRQLDIPDPPDWWKQMN